MRPASLPGMAIEIQTFDNVPQGELTAYDKKLHALGIMKTIYVPVHPRVTEIKIELGRAAERTVNMFQNPHRRQQDLMHEMFFETYGDWSRAALNLDLPSFPFQYPASGSNEAIRETIAFHASQSQTAGQEPRIHVFEGEYEGYTAHAQTHNVTIVKHSRDDFEASLEHSLKPGEPFYLSMPSGIDGNIWPDYDRFLRHLENRHPMTRLMVDLAYLNTTQETPIIRTDSPVIDGIFISMSKSYPGTYYDRVGGLISKTQMPGLYGNKWFKNLNGLLLGINLMTNSPLGEIPADMARAQRHAIDKLRGVLGDDLTPSDVTFIATQDVPEDPSEIQKSLLRAGKVRYCLTPSIIEFLHK